MTPRPIPSPTTRRVAAALAIFLRETDGIGVSVASTRQETWNR